MWTVEYWKQTAERAVKTAAQGFIALAAAAQFDVLTFDWTKAAGVVAGMALLSFVTSLASNGFGPEDSPSVV